MDAEPAAGPKRFQLARVFDRVDPVTGPAFADDHPVIADRELSALLARRLNAGVVVLATTALMDDVLEPSCRATVPMNYRTDGAWIWTDTVTYYLEQYGLAPEDALVRHLLHENRATTPLRRDVAEAAVAFILTPPGAGGGGGAAWAAG